MVPGDFIGIAAPAGPPDLDRLAAGVEWLLQRRFKIHVASNAYLRRGYLAGTDEERAAKFNCYLTDPELKGIIMARGGYGSLRILDKISYAAASHLPKVIVGYSDATALLNAIWAKTGLVTFHGPMAAVEFSTEPSAFTVDSLLAMVSGSKTDEVLYPTEGKTWEVIRPGKAIGPLIGGCLSLVVSLVGTPYLPETQGAILLLEETNEDPYKIDRMLHHLKLSGILETVAGVVLGAMINCVPNDPEPSLSLPEVFDDVFGAATYPVVAGVPIGHGGDTLTVPIGGLMCLDTRLGLSLAECPVRCERSELCL